MGNGYVRTTLRGLLAAALFFGLALAGPQDNSLVIASSQEPNVIAGDFLAVLNNLAVSSEIAGYHDAPLIGLDLSGENFPVLVTELPTVQNGRVKFTDVQGGKKRLEINLTLKENLKWSDGQALDTDDIAFYYEVGKAPGMPVGNPDYWDRVGLKVSDKRNFTVTFEPASAVDLIGSPMGLAPQHAMRAEWEKAKASVKGLDLQKDAEKIAEAYRSFFAAFSNPQAINAGRMVYSGPFRVSRWVPGSTLELVRNPNFSALTPPGGADK
jgi:peptide/nickel transport system substrate-binding protein